MTDSGPWARCPDLAVVERPGRVVVLPLAHPRAARPFVMTGSAEAVWRALDTPRTTAQVVAHVATDFGLPAAEVEADVVSFLVELERRGLIEHGDGSQPGI